MFLWYTIEEGNVGRVANPSDIQSVFEGDRNDDKDATF